MGSRDAILSAIRRSLARAPDADAAAVSERVHRHARNLVPARGSIDRDGQLALFVRQIEETHATVAHVATPADVPKAVAAYLAQHNLAAEVVRSPDPMLAALDWAGQPLLHVRAGVPRPSDQVGVTPAFAAIAETGTLLLTSGAERPQTLHLLPEHHIVVLGRDQIVGSMEDCWDRLRAAGGMPRTAMFVSGPSSTADIELTHYLGAHGPRRLHIIVVDR